MKLLVWLACIACVAPCVLGAQTPGSVQVVPSLLSGQTPGPAHKEGRLTVYLTTAFGGEISGGQLSIKDDGGALVYSHDMYDVKGLATVTLPYGTYSVSYNGPLWLPAQRNVVVDQSVCFLVLALPWGGMELGMPQEPTAISLKVRPQGSCTAGGVLWAKLVDTRSDYARERRIEWNGGALFDSLDYGDYVVVVVDGKQVRGLQHISPTGPVSLLEIALSGCE